MRPIRTFSWEGHETPSTALISKISEVVKKDPTALDSLYENVDPESVDQLLSRASFSGSIQFEYAGFLVDLHSNGVGYLFNHQAPPIAQIEEVDESVRYRERCLRQ